MKTLDTLTKDEVHEQYKLSMAFIKRHADDMGGIGKPLVFDRELVELFVRDLMTKNIRKEALSAAGVADLNRYIERRVEQSRNGITGTGKIGQILGQGGRGTTNADGPRRKPIRKGGWHEM